MTLDTLSGSSRGGRSFRKREYRMNSFIRYLMSVNRFHGFREVRRSPSRVYREVNAIFGPRLDG